MEIQEILSLIEAVSEHGLTELKLDDGQMKLSLKKEDKNRGAVSYVLENPAAMPNASVMMQPAGTMMPSVPETGNASMPSAATSTSAQEFSPEQVVASPLVGTFYSASSPEADNFVKVGDTVKKGQVLGIVEAMKLMNEIESDYDGVVEEILVKNEDVVEYGQPLFRIK
jgi:acetyl-CoA carboxylase biotin carboxyl carrier protein